MKKPGKSSKHYKKVDKRPFIDVEYTKPLKKVKGRKETPLSVDKGLSPLYKNHIKDLETWASDINNSDKFTNNIVNAIGGWGYKKKYNRVLFSGRFDPGHVGHWISCLRLLEHANKVIIVILNYENRNYNVGYSEQMFRELINRSFLSDRFEVCVNTTHFAKITKQELEKFKCDAYAAAGNFEVLNHIDSLGMLCIHMDRAYDYEAHRYIPKYKEIKTGGKNMKNS